LNLTLFEFFEKFYYDEDSVFRNEHIKAVEMPEGDLYYERYLYYDRNYLFYFKNEKANKIRIDVNKRKPRKKLK